MKTPQLIGMTGRKRSGKSTAAKALQSHFIVISFADPIKAMARAIGVTQEELDGDKEAILPRFGCSVRFMLQTLGTEWGRNIIAHDLWIGIAKRRAEKYLSVHAGVVFDDVRFDNEAAMIHELGGEIWHVGGGRDGDGHISEAGIDIGLVDRKLVNPKDESFGPYVRAAAGLPERMRI